jgi:hypothetical protein
MRFGTWMNPNDVGGGEGPELMRRLRMPAEETRKPGMDGRKRESGRRNPNEKRKGLTSFF